MSYTDYANKTVHSEIESKYDIRDYTDTWV